MQINNPAARHPNYLFVKEQWRGSFAATPLQLVTRSKRYFFFATVPGLRSAACAAARRATGTRKGEQLTYARPIWWQKTMLDGSPPCSPQIPSLMSGRALSLFNGDLHDLADAGRV